MSLENALTSRKDLLDTLQHLKQDFDLASKEARNFDQRFVGKITDFSRNCQGISNKLQQNLAQNNTPLKQMFLDLDKGIKSSINQWQKDFASITKGFEFRDKFNDSLLVYAYGKVKSGKSSLGNYIAWGSTDPDEDYRKANLSKNPDFKPVYTTAAQATNVKDGDAEGDAQKNSRFRVGETEATSSIQSFSLPGLTWVDSPGLHSAQGNNGALAKEYVKHADLIVYTTNSSSPARESDLQEIIELALAGKRMLILITGSDTVDEDVDDDGNLIYTTIMKDLKNREEQKDYVLKEINQFLRDNHIEPLTADRVISISAKYAAEHEGEPDKLQDSGLADFFAELKQISETEGVLEKKILPYKNYAGCLETSESILNDLKNKVDTFSLNLQNQKAALERLAKSKRFEYKENLRRYLDDHLYLSMSDRNQGQDVINDKIKTLSLEAEQYVYRILDDYLKSVFSEVAKQVQNTVQKSQLKLSVPEFAEDMDVRQYIDYTPSKKSWGILGALAGGVIGFFAGGPVGAAVGSSLGATGGTIVGRARQSVNSYEVKVGDNYNEIENSIKTQLKERFDDLAEKNFAKNISNFFESFNQGVARLVQEINKMSADLSQAKVQINREIQRRRG